MNTLNIPQNEDFIMKWNDFFKAIEKAGLSKITNGGGRLEKLKPPFTHVINIITEENTTEHIGKEINRLRAEDNGDIMIAALFAEMGFVVSLESSNESEEKTLAAGQTVKESIESLFDPPRWLKKILKVLNELLSLVRGGA